MPAPPYFAQLPLDGNSRRYVDQSAWDSVIGAFYAWPDHVNANQKNLSNLGVLTFGAGGRIAGPLKVGQDGSSSEFGGIASLIGATNAQTSLFLWQIGIGSAHIGFLSGDRTLFIRNTQADGQIANGKGIAIDYLGNVGIGTDSPTYLLDVGAISGATSNSLRVGSGAGYDSSLLLKEASDGYGFTLRNVHNAGLSFIRHHGDATGVSALYIERATGNVGIGTASPHFLLDLNNSAAARKLAVFANSEGSDFYGFGIGAGQLRYDAGLTGSHVFVVNDQSTEVMRLTPAGIVIQSAPGSYNDTLLFNRSGSLVVDETAKKLYFRYKDSGGVCHSIELGGPYA